MHIFLQKKMDLQTSCAKLSAILLKPQCVDTETSSFVSAIVLIKHHLAHCDLDEQQIIHKVGHKDHEMMHGQ